MRLFRWIFVVSLLLVSSGVRAQTRLTRNGKPAARIVVAQQTAADLTAAQLLQRFVRESTGATLPLLHDVTPRKGDILIGASDTAGLAEDGFRLRTQEGVLRISSGGDKGAVYGVMTLLERYLGLDYFAAGVYDLDRTPTVTLPAMDFAENPAFRYRQSQGYGMAQDSVYRLALRLKEPRDIFAGGLWVHTFNSLLQYYDGEADMPGGLSRADYDADRWQSTRPYDRFWGRRKLASLGYQFQPDSQHKFNIQGFYTQTLRSGYLEQGKRITLSPRNYWVRGIEPRYSQIFMIGPSAHEVGVGYRYVNESTHEMRYYTATSSGQLPSGSSPYDRDTRSGTEAHAWYLDDKIDIGNWTITPGMRFEHIESYQNNAITGTHEEVSYNAPLPALNVLYHLTDSWNLYANTEGSFGTVQYSQIGKAVQSGNVEPEKARTWELGTRYDDGALTAEMGLFLINFNNQYDSNQTNDTVTARGKTRHTGLETQARYDLGTLTPTLDNVSIYASYAYVNAEIREKGDTYGNLVPFSPKHKGTLGVDYKPGNWTFNLNSDFQSSQFADNANTVKESADGSTGRIPGFMLWGARVAYDFGPQMADLNLAFGVKNIFDQDYFIRSYDDNNKGIYAGQPRTLYMQGSLKF